jgi:hypothetical protein
VLREALLSGPSLALAGVHDTLFVASVGRMMSRKG